MTKVHTCYHTVIESSGGTRHYFGKHSTFDINDGYIGSGNYIAISKKLGYPAKVIDRAIFESEELAYEFEALLVSEGKSKFKTCVNMKPGGAWWMYYTK